MAEKEKFVPPAVGGISLLTVFAVLCLTVFALLSLSTVQADSRLAEASADAVQNYYAADCAAQEILARLRSGEQPEGVEFWGNDAVYASYVCPISQTQQLQVTVELLEVWDDEQAEDYAIIRWQVTAVGDWTPDEGLNIWDGKTDIWGGG